MLFRVGILIATCNLLLGKKYVELVIQVWQSRHFHLCESAGLPVWATSSGIGCILRLSVANKNLNPLQATV